MPRGCRVPWILWQTDAIGCRYGSVIYIHIERSGVCKSCRFTVRGTAGGRLRCLAGCRQGQGAGSGCASVVRSGWSAGFLRGHGGCDLHTYRALRCMYSNPPKASYGVAPPRRTTAYCLRRRAWYEAFMRIVAINAGCNVVIHTAERSWCMYNRLSGAV